MNTLDQLLKAKLNRLDAQSIRRRLVPTSRDGIYITRSGRRLVSFSCNDYLGLAQDPRVRQAAIAAITEDGAGAGASRLITGTYPLITELEAALAVYRGTEAALVFSSGYLATLGVIPSIVGRGDLLLIDELSHSCILAAAKLSDAAVVHFRHNDIADVNEQLAQHRAAARHCLIVTERVFSMDGDCAPIADMIAAARDFDAWVMTDDAHGIGVALAGDDAVDIRMGTLSKAFGSCGGYIAGSRILIDFLISRARSFVYTTGLPPAAAGAAHAALAIINAEPARVARPLMLARRFTAALDLPPAASVIVPLPVGEASAALALSAALEAEGFLAVAIRPPTVPPGTARLRLSFSALHDDAMVDDLAAAIGRLWHRRAMS